MKVNSLTFSASYIYILLGEKNNKCGLITTQTHNKGLLYPVSTRSVEIHFYFHIGQHGKVNDTFLAQKGLFCISFTLRKGCNKTHSQSCLG